MSSCGNVLSQRTDIPSRCYLSWVQRNPLRFNKCRECKILPICVGGCPDLHKQSGDGLPVCDSIKYNISSVIDFYCKCLTKGV